MSKNYFLRSLQSFVVIPILATNFATIPLDSTKLPTAAVSVTEQKNGQLVDGLSDNQQALLVQEANQIDNYFRDNQMPLAGTGMKMIQAARENDLDPFLIPAIAVRESTGGIHACKNVRFNAWGWNGCKVGFHSYDEAIDTIAKHLGGNDEKTAHYYENKTTMQILEAYNPRYIVAKYPEQVLRIMQHIASHATKEA